MINATKEYTAWHNMKTRCTNPNATGYEHYGGRGIRVCDEWLGSFEAFLAHVGNAPSPRHTLDRINGEGNYEPGNVRWATWVVQNKNKRRPQRQVVRGVPAPDDLKEAACTLVYQLGDEEAAKELKMARCTLARVVAGMPLNEGTLALLEVRFGRAAS